jgi:hypothetical protein
MEDLGGGGGGGMFWKIYHLHEKMFRVTKINDGLKCDGIRHCYYM